MHPHEKAGEILKLGPPASGEMTITIDPGVAAAAFAAGTQTLLPGAQIPVCKHLNHDLMLFVHKGQGRATLGERTMAVVPGVMLSAPRGTWYGLRNTGTGLLHIAWAGTPGLEALFRDLSRVGASPSGEALQALAQRHQVEFRPAAAAPIPTDPRHRRRRGRRGGGRSSAQGRSQPGHGRPVPPVSSVMPSVSAVAAAPSGHGRRPHRRRSGSRPRTASPASAAKPLTPLRAIPPSDRQTSGRRPSHSRKVKEVYMGGRWIRVEGDGPVIAPRRARPDPNRNRDDDTPPLSVAL